MRHRKRKVTLDRRSGPRRQLLRGLVVNVLLRERVRTTAAKARAARPIVERCIAVGRTDSVVHRRYLLALLANRPATAKALEVLGPRYRDRAGGYTRTTPLSRRRGDGAPMVLIELV